jgi:alpha-D-xyloside xylohydrolase
VEAELAKIPLHVRAGSILPLGPVKPYADARSDEPLEIRVYPGADGSFELYDDEGDGFGYQRGRYATVRFAWHDERGVLEIGSRQGRFPSMPVKQKLRLACGAAGAKFLEILYTGKTTTAALPDCRSSR